ncbi:DNA-binding barrel domain superfamily [Sesbania bispinosa]|nr:DNA-binding barrel domain superfamily [Sesbania bispinosa]
MRTFYSHWETNLLNSSVTLTDPAGNIHNVWVRNNKKIGLFREGVREFIDFYGLNGTYSVNFNFNGSSNFDIKIMNSECLEIPYTPSCIESPPSVVSLFRHAPTIDEFTPQENMPNLEAAATHPLPSQSTQIPESPLEEAHNRSPVNPQRNDEEENVNDEAGMLLWRARITKAIEGGKQGAVIPKRIVTEFLEQGQQVVHVMLPQGAVQPWALLWNTILHNHCKLGQGWYQFCREESLKKVMKFHFGNLMVNNSGG